MLPDDPAPDWFLDALAETPKTGEVDVDGCPIAWRGWGDPGAPGLVLLHGNTAHSRWWDHLAPLLVEHGARHVVALDLSGYGDSGWRERYGLAQWAEEILAVARDAGMADRPVLLGHSMGGYAVLAAAAADGDRLGGAIIADTPVRRPGGDDQQRGRRGRWSTQSRTYPDMEVAISRFRLVPEQPPPAPYLFEHVARHSLRQTDEGWRWKFDPAVFDKWDESWPADFGELLSHVTCRFAVVYGERSTLVDRDGADYVAERLGRPMPAVAVPTAYHHLILDEPIAFVSAVRALLADWRPEAPRPGREIEGATP